MARFTHPRLTLPVCINLQYLRTLFLPTVDDMPMYAAACAAVDDREPINSPLRRMQIAFLSMMQLQHLQSWDLVAAFLQQVCALPGAHRHPLALTAFPLPISRHTLHRAEAKPCCPIS